MFLWKRAFQKAHGAVLLIKKYQEVTHRIQIFGDLSERKPIEEEEEQLNIEDAKCVILPDNKHKIRWNLWVALLLIYTGIFVPMRVAYFDEAEIGMIIFECFVDAFFITDLVLTFFSAYERKDGQIEIRHKYIAIAYLKFWFWIDLGSSIPFQLLELNQEQVTITDALTGEETIDEGNLKLARIARLPRLYRIVRILRLFKMFRFLKHNKSLKNLSEFFQITSGVS